MVKLSLRKLFQTVLDPEIVGPLMLFHHHQHAQGTLNAGQSTRISTGISMQDIPQGYVLQVQPTQDLISNGVVGQTKHYSTKHKGHQIVSTIVNLSKAAQSLYKGGKFLKGILKKADVEDIQILPALLAMENDQKNHDIFKTKKIKKL